MFSRPASSEKSSRSRTARSHTKSKKDVCNGSNAVGLVRGSASSRRGRRPKPETILSAHRVHLLLLERSLANGLTHVPGRTMLPHWTECGISHDRFPCGRNRPLRERIECRSGPSAKGVRAKVARRRELAQSGRLG